MAYVYKLINAAFGLSNIALKRIKVARFNELNDPFELLAVDCINRNIRAGIYAWKKKVEQSEGLICFSKDWRNPVLWSHYADSHRGMALGFEVPDNLLVEVNYVQNIPTKLSSLLKSEQDTPKHIINAELARLKHTKYYDWNYEKELRLFLPLSSTQRGISNLIFEKFSEQLVLRQVILGALCDLPSTELTNLLTSTYSHHVRLSRAKLAYRKFAVVEDVPKGP